MKPFKLYLALFTSVLTLSSNAFAIDQVILKNGNIVEGKILSDVPNRHVDIQLVNGNKKRFQQSEVASLERDVPSNTDSQMSGNSSEVFFGVNLGGYLINLSGADLRFNWGARFGVNATQLGDFSKLAFGLAFNNSSLGSALTTSGTASVSISELMLEVLFRKVANSGFYFGPELGLLTASASIGSLSGSVSKFNFGVLTGYDYYFNNGFSLGPEVRFTNISAFSQFKFLLGGTFHF